MKIALLTNSQIVTIAVAQLGGDAHFIDKEDVAVQANIIAPGRFNWRKYPDQIDLSAVTYSLGDAKKEKNGLLIGNAKTGWMLSPIGLAWIESISSSELDNDSLAKNRLRSIMTNQIAEAGRLRSTKAYELFEAGHPEEITLVDYYQFVRINEYFQAKAVERRYAIIDAAVFGDEPLSELWKRLKGTFDIR